MNKKGLILIILMGLVTYYLLKGKNAATGVKNALPLNRLLASQTAKKLGYTEQFNPSPDIIRNLVLLWDKLQHFANYTFNSVYRAKRTNDKVGGKSNSAHLRGLAVDISTKGLTQVQVDVLVNELIERGFFRIGLGATLIHADIDKSLPYPAVFEYTGKHKTPEFLSQKKTAYLSKIKSLKKYV